MDLANIRIKKDANMKIRMSSWDKWAPALYLFIIGLALGLVIGFGLGITGYRSTDKLAFLILPVGMIVFAFLVLTILSHRVDGQK